MAKSIAPALVTPDDIIEYDLDSNPVNANGRGSFLERFIHGEIYKARPDVNAVVHSHSPSVIPFGHVNQPMRAMYHNAAFLAEGVPTFRIEEKFGATDMLVGNGEKGAALAQVLGEKCVVLMRAHGSGCGWADVADGGVPGGLYGGQRTGADGNDDSRWRRDGTA